MLSARGKGRFPLFIDSRLRAVSYWLRLVKMEENRLPKIAYRREILETNKKFNWAHEIKNILDRAGFSDVWQSQGVIYERAFIRNLGRRLKDIYMQDWTAKCGDTPRCDIYKSFKNSFEMEKYVKSLNINKFMYAMARLRVGAAELNTNRKYIQNNPELNCPFCEAEETELHFLRDCPTYANLRAKYIYPHYDNDSIQTLGQYFHTSDTPKIRSLAQYIHHAFLTRSREIACNKERKRYLSKHNQKYQNTQTSNTDN